MNRGLFGLSNEHIDAVDLTTTNPAPGLASGNSFFGYRAGGTATPVNASCTAFGYLAGSQNAAAGNTYFGYQAGPAVTSGINNTLLGSMAGALMTTGSNNVCVGYQAGLSNNNSTGVFIGAAAGTNSTGQYQTIVGYGAGYNSFGSTYSTFIGYESGLSNSGSWNTAVGYNSLMSASGGATAVGWGAGQNASGQYGCYFGYAVGTGVTGANNTMVGTLSGNSPAGTAANITTSAVGQTLLGFQTGQASTTQVNYITCLGYQTTAGAAGVVAIGVDHTGASATSSTQDEIVLGTTLHGLRLGNTAGSLTATTGFAYLSTVAGTPTGVPSAKTNYTPLQFDSTNGRLWAYYGAAWHYVAFT